jgi:hypothetical protein
MIFDVSQTSVGQLPPAAAGIKFAYSQNYIFTFVSQHLYFFDISEIDQKYSVEWDDDNSADLGSTYNGLYDYGLAITPLRRLILSGGLIDRQQSTSGYTSIYSLLLDSPRVFKLVSFSKYLLLHSRNTLISIGNEMVIMMNQNVVDQVLVLDLKLWTARHVLTSG